MVNEQDVVVAFRQAVEEELRRAQEDGNQPREELFGEGVSSDETLRRLAARYEELEHEVKLLRTIILKLISEPVDEQQ